MTKRQISVLTILTTLTLSILIVLVPSDYVSAAPTIQVPSAQYPTITSALTSAANGTTIGVAAGTYNENVIYSGNGSYSYLNDITLQGSTNTIINGNVTFAVMRNLKVDNFVINGNLTVGIGQGGDVQNSTVSNIKGNPNVRFMNAQSVTLSHSNVNGILLMAYAMGAGDTWITIADNSISGGITLGASRNNLIVGNTIAGASVGIYDYSQVVSWHTPAGSNTMIGNTIQNCGVGIKVRSWIAYTTPDNITQNTIKNNGVGIEIPFGSSDPSTGAPASNNTIYQNSFINNNLQVNCTGKGADNWSFGNPPKGNFWSDYTGVDSNHDGIGDTPYVINQYNVDNYPLVPASPATPTPSPTLQPTSTPTTSPTAQPTATPTATPTQNPSDDQTNSPTATPNQTTNSDPASNESSDPTATAIPSATETQTIPELTSFYQPFVVLAALTAMLSLLVVLKKAKQTTRLATKHSDSILSKARPFPPRMESSCA